MKTNKLFIENHVINLLNKKRVNINDVSSKQAK